MSLDEHSTPTTPGGKPSKPRPDFPLFAHAAGVWAKKIRGKLHYFGPWGDPEGALRRYLERKDVLHAGLQPRADPTAVTVKDVVNTFLSAKKARLSSRELSVHTWAKYKTACDEIVAAFGRARLAADLSPADFTRLRQRMATKWGPQRLAVNVQHVRSVFKYAYEAELLERPLRFGPEFKKPSKKVLRLHRAGQGKKLFSAEDCHALLQAAGRQLRAMFLLALNCGFGNNDCATLPREAVDLGHGWIDYARPKTGVRRRCPLWPETVAALREVERTRPSPRDPAHAGLVFVTKYGGPWFKDSDDSPVAKETAKLLVKLGLRRRKGLGFYTLRHTFRTVADAARDQPAVRLLMGHAEADIDSVYREEIDDARLVAVTDHVRAWLFGPTAQPG